jgi:hypothetical protein
LRLSEPHHEAASVPREADAIRAERAVLGAGTAIAVSCCVAVVPMA